MNVCDFLYGTKRDFNDSIMYDVIIIGSNKKFESFQEAKYLYSEAKSALKKPSHHPATQKDKERIWRQATDLMLKMNELVNGCPFHFHFDTQNGYELLFYQNSSDGSLHQVDKFPVVKKEFATDTEPEDNEDEIEDDRKPAAKPTNQSPRSHSPSNKNKKSSPASVTPLSNKRNQVDQGGGVWMDTLHLNKRRFRDKRRSREARKEKREARNKAQQPKPKDHDSLEVLDGADDSPQEARKQKGETKNKSQQPKPEEKEIIEILGDTDDSDE